MLQTYQITATRALLLQNMPSGSQLLNLDNNNQIWISDQPGLQSGQGIPIPGQGTFVKQGDGPLYAILDAAATGPVTLLASDAIDQYNNPVGIGLVIAQQLLNTGIPNVLTTTTITTTDTITGGNFKQYNVAGYASLIIGVSVAGNATPNYGVSMWQGASLSGALNNPTSSERLTLQPNTIPGGPWAAAMLVPVTGPVMLIKNEDTADGVSSVATMTIIGSNRPVSRPYTNNRFTGMGNQFDRLAQTLPVGTTLITPNGQTVSGPCKLFVRLSDTASAFACRATYADGLGNTVDNYLFSTSDLDVLANGTRIGMFDVSMPMNVYTLQLDVDIAAVSNVDFRAHFLTSV